MRAVGLTVSVGVLSFKTTKAGVYMYTMHAVLFWWQQELFFGSKTEDAGGCQPEVRTGLMQKWPAKLVEMEKS